MITPTYKIKIRLVSTAARIASRYGKETMAENLIDKAWNIWDAKMDKEYNKAAAR